MIKIPGDKVIYVDCDNTLILWKNDSSEYELNFKAIEKVKQFAVRGQVIVIWSAGGVNWCEEVAKLTGLSLLTNVILICKPTWFMDDLPASEFLKESDRILP